MSLTTRMAGLRAMMRFDNRWQLIFNRLFFNSTIMVYRYKNCKILVDHDGGDATGVRKCLSTDMYRQFIPLMKLDHPLTILDCGANTGGFPLLFHTEGFALAKIVGVEMNPYTCTRLRYNLFTNLEVEIICLNAVVEDTTRVHSLCFGQGSTGDSLFNENKTGKRFRIQSRSLDDVIAEHFGDAVVDIVKIDIEGAEYMLFAGRNFRRLSQCRHLVIEIHRLEGRSEQEVISAIQALGFALIKRRADVFLFSQ